MLATIHRNAVLRGSPSSHRIGYSTRERKPTTPNSFKIRCSTISPMTMPATFPTSQAVETAQAPSMGQKDSPPTLPPRVCADGIADRQNQVQHVCRQQTGGQAEHQHRHREEPVFFCTVASTTKLWLMSMIIARIVTWRSVSGIEAIAAMPE